MEFIEPAMRPPQEAASLLLRATQGCTWNKCNFCYVSRGYRFMAVKPEDLATQAAKSKHFFRPDTKIYLTGSNPFALPTAKLKAYIQALRQSFPQFSRLSMQSRIDDIARKDDAQLEELRSLGLTHLYIGTENGSEEALALMNKGHTARDTITQLKRLDQAGIAYTNFYVIGLMGKGHGKSCGKATAAMFNQVNPERITTTGMTIFANAPVAEMVNTCQFTPASEREKIEELHTFLSDLEIDVIYDGRHYLNPLNYRFANADKAAKAKVLQDIEDTLASYSDAELELMVGRERMVSL